MQQFWDNSEFIKNIIDGMYDWVRVIDRDNNVIFVNRALSEGLKSMSGERYNNPLGKKCFETIGRCTPCENCISRKAVFDGNPHEKEEVVGNRIFSVMSSPVKNKQGEIKVVVEVFRDVTRTRELQERVIKQNLELQYDLNIAKKLQCSLLPKNLPEGKPKFSFIYKPCESLGGDFLDIFRIDREHLGIYIADVSGHGVPASMLTVFLRSTINKKLLSPAAALAELFREYNSSSFDPDLYITVFYAILDTTNNTLTYSNAGHNVPPVLFSSDRFELLRVPGVPISNWVDEPEYKDMTIGLEAGDRLFMCTDGIVELRNPEGQQYGEDRMLNILLNDRSEPNYILNYIMEDAARFSGAAASDKICDDVTMVLMEIEE